MTEPTFTTQKDDNYSNAIYGISCIDGVTPVRIQFSSIGMLVDTTTAISVTPKEITQLDNNSVPVAKGVSSADGKTILPWYVVPSTGAVLTNE
jgi:hypothetical protein